MKFLTAGVLLAAVGTTRAAPVSSSSSESSNTTAKVDLLVNRGSSQHWASGAIYGIPDNADQIPNSWFSDIDFQYGRSGGAQLGAPQRGWVWGMTDYEGRLNSTLSNYRKCRENGAAFVILPHDIWGTDQTNSSSVWPGDNGDWTDYDNFVKQLMSDLKANDALEGMVYDIWNEPDQTFFWKRSKQQWIDLYIRTHQLIRNDSSYDSILLSGPTLSDSPYTNNDWWNDWASQIAGNSTVPDQYAYHLEGGGANESSDLETNKPALESILAQYGLPSRQVNINEYATLAEQVPSGAAWWISRFERYDTWGLRGNWQSDTELHDFIANLLTKSNVSDYSASDYSAAPEYPIYQYYAQMPGDRVQTNGSVDRMFDVYATLDSSNNTVSILAGTIVKTGNYSIEVSGLTSLGLESSGNVSVQTYKYPGGADVWAYAPSRVDLGSSSTTYSNDVLTINVDQTNSTTAWAFEISP